MRTEPFLSLCIRNEVSILIPRDKKLGEYKNKTKDFNYPCKFNRIGKCIATVLSSDCGCEDCAYKFGYIRHIRFAQYTINKYAALFDQRTGFWRSNKSCILPRNLRSVRCLTHICIAKRKEFESMNSKEAVEFIGLLSKYTTLSDEEKEKLHNLYLNI